MLTNEIQARPNRLYAGVQQSLMVSYNRLTKETAKVPMIVPATMHPPILLIDGDVKRAQRLARLLILADYRPYVVTSTLYAFRRFLQEPFVPQAIILGQVEDKGRFAFTRLFQWLLSVQGKDIPIITLPQDRFVLTRLLRQLVHELKRDITITALLAQIPAEAPLAADQSSSSFHIVSDACTQVLEAIWSVLPATRSRFKLIERSLVLERLPIAGLLPRVSKECRSRNSHLRQVLTTAYELIGPSLWETLISDVGLAEYCFKSSWPPDDHERAIPAEYLSCLNQAVALSCPEDPAGQLRRWSDRGTQMSLEKRTPSMLTQQVLKLLPEEKVMSAVLKAFTGEMNEIRGEELHVWKQQPDGSYWIIHYSNLYAYGRTYRREPACHVWVASIEATLRLVHLDKDWEVSELECSCQTQTGHCVFAVQPRHNS